MVRLETSLPQCGQDCVWHREPSLSCDVMWAFNCSRSVPGVSPEMLQSTDTSTFSSTLGGIGWAQETDWSDYSKDRGFLGSGSGEGLRLW